MLSHVLEQKKINEEYKIWRKNVPHLYDLMFSHVLEWPSLSVQWFPDAKREEESGRTSQRLLLSTHTSGSEGEYILIAKIEFPDEFDESLNEGTGNEEMKLKIVQRIPVVEEANRVRYNPSACNVLATRSDVPDIHLYDYTRHLSHATIPRPDAILRGHESGGFGLSWNLMETGILASCGEDRIVCLFDIGKEGTVIQPTMFLRKHESPVNDCSFSFIERGILGSVDDDGVAMLWDLRVGESVNVVKSGCGSEMHTVRFSPRNGNMFATGSGDGSVRVWDKRNLDQPQHLFSWHRGEVTSVEWSPHSGNILASCGSDRRVCVWDMNRTGIRGEGSEELEAEGPSELLFLHGGHTSVVNDIAWNHAEQFEIASVGEDNVLQVWQIPGM